MKLAISRPSQDDSRRIFWLGHDDSGWLDLSQHAGVQSFRDALLHVQRSPAPPTSAFTVRELPAMLEPTLDATSRILCAGLNFRTHASEANRELPANPSFFARFASSFVGHGQPVIAPRVSDTLDWEGEAAVVIGKTVRNATAEQALDCIAGYTCMGEHSVREFQRHSTQATAGKNFDASGALGPWVVLRNPQDGPAGHYDPRDHTVSTWVDGERMQHAPLSDLVFDVQALIRYASTFMALQPGDVIALGTPKGVGARMTPPRYLQPGETVEVGVSGIGRLSNPVIASSS